MTKGNGGAPPEELPEPLIKRRPPEPFPTEELGNILEGATRAIAAKVQCAPVMAAQSVLAVASLAAQGLVDVRLPHGQTRPASLYFVTVAESGARKSSTDTEAMAPVRMREKNLGLVYDVLKKNYNVEHAAWKAQHLRIERDTRLEKDGRRAKLEELGPEPEAPVKPYLTVSEGTAEGLAKFMPKLPGALGIFSAEGSQFLNGYGFGPETKLRTAATFSEVWDGKGLRRARAGSDDIINLPGRRLSCHLMIQPDAARDVLSDPALRGQGLLSRILVAAPDSLAGTRMWQEPADGIQPALSRYIARILQVFETLPQTVNIQGNELDPYKLELSPEARKAWITFHNEVELQKGTDGCFAEIRDFAEKAAEQAARIAAVLADVDDPLIVFAGKEIGFDAMDRGCAIVTWYLNETLRLAAEYCAPQAVGDAQMALAWIQAHGLKTVDASTLLTRGPGALRSKVRLDPAIAVLVATRWLTLNVPEPGSKARSWTVAQETGP